MNRGIQQRLQWVKLYETSVMRDLYAVAVAFLGPHCVNGGEDIWLRASLFWKATAVAPSVHHQRKQALAKLL